MAGIGMFGVGLAGLNANRRALDITSNNIANVNTEGYSRQRANFSLENSLPEVSVRRSYDSFISNQVRSNTSSTGYLESFSELSNQVDSSLSDAQAGIMPGMQRFFNAIQTLSNDPASPTARQTLLSEAETMAGNFNSLGQRLDQLNNGLNGKLNTLTNQINNLSSGIADINQRIFHSQASGLSASNNLLDQRDQMIQELSELTSVTTVEQDDGAMNVFIGSGQTVVAGFDSFKLSTARNGFDPSQMEIMIESSGGKIEISDLMKGSGAIGGVLDFRSQVLDETRNTLGKMAVGITTAFNEQNRAGIDLNGQAGGDFFKPIDQSSASILINENNRGSAVVDASISNANQLTGSDYTLARTTEGYQLTRMSDQQITKLSQFPANPEVVDGIEFSLQSGGMAEGDRIQIQPTRNAATAMGLAITHVNDIAAAAPLVNAAAFENTGAGVAGDINISDSATFVAGNYTVQMATNSGAVADAGVTRGTIMDNSGDSDLQYELKINNVSVFIQNEASAALTDLDALSAEINLDTANTGVKSYVDNGQLFLTNDPPSPRAISVTEALSTTSGTIEDGDTVTGYFGATLTGQSSPEVTTTFSNNADSYIVLDDTDTPVTSNAYTSGLAITFNGISTSVTGSPDLGDTFSVGPNQNGVGDNRNLMKMAELQSTQNMGGGTTTFGDVYGQMASKVGSSTQQANINLETQSALLVQSQQARDAKAGVNLDEEAANLMRYEQAYQASAQVITVANSMFDTLLNAVR